MNSIAPPTSRADATRARILAAATAEFSAYGIAGARVDRIAAAAEANKNLIYIYFGSKDRLFDAVFDAGVVRVMDEVPFTAGDLPEYAGRLHDHYLEHPEVVRLATWHRLERGGGEQPPAVFASYASKLERLAAAQREGQVDAAFPPAAVLAVVLAIAGAWSAAGPAVVPPLQGEELSHRARRRAIVESVRRLIAPPDTSSPVTSRRRPRP